MLVEDVKMKSKINKTPSLSLHSNACMISETDVCQVASFQFLGNYNLVLILQILSNIHSFRYHILFKLLSSLTNKIERTSAIITKHEWTRVKWYHFASMPIGRKWEIKIAIAVYYWLNFVKSGNKCSYRRSFFKFDIIQTIQRNCTIGCKYCRCYSLHKCPPLHNEYSTATP